MAENSRHVLYFDTLYSRKKDDYNRSIGKSSILVQSQSITEHKETGLCGF